MYADELILNLDNLKIENKNLLPTYSGIYYVIDEKSRIWYIGKSKNLQKRWNGEPPHHRFHQLMSIAIREQTQLFIYFFQTTNNRRHQQEKEQIKKYQPLLNYTPVIRSTKRITVRTSGTSLEYPTLKILSDKIDNFSQQKMMTNIEETSSNSINKESELLDAVVKLKSNRFKRQFIHLKDEKINLNLEIEICIDSKNRLFVRHYTICNIYGWGIKIIQEKDDSNVENALLNLNSKCAQLYNRSLKWLGYKLKCDDIILIDEEDDFEIETMAIMLPFRLFIDLVEDLWLKDSSLSKNLETQENAYFRTQFISLKIAKYLDDRNLTLRKLTEQINQSLLTV